MCRRHWMSRRVSRFHSSSHNGRHTWGLSGVIKKPFTLDQDWSQQPHTSRQARCIVEEPHRFWPTHVWGGESSRWEYLATSLGWNGYWQKAVFFTQIARVIAATEVRVESIAVVAAVDKNVPDLQQIPCDFLSVSEVDINFIGIVLRELVEGSINHLSHDICHAPVFALFSNFCRCFCSCHIRLSHLLFLSQVVCSVLHILICRDSVRGLCCAYGFCKIFYNILTFWAEGGGRCV